MSHYAIKGTSKWQAEEEYKLEDGTTKRMRKRFDTEAQAKAQSDTWRKLKRRGKLALPKAATVRGSLTVRELAQQCLASRSIGKAANYVQCQTLYLGRFLDWLERVKVDPRDVNGAHLRDFQVHLVRGLGMKSSSTNQHMTAAIQFLKYLQSANLIREVPRGLRMPPRDQTKRRPLTPDEAHALIAQLREQGSPVEADFITASIFTALRKTALLELPRARLIASPPSLRLGRQKNGETITLPLSPELYALLDARLPWDTTVNKLRGAMDRATTALGWHKDPDLHFTVHGARHTAATWALGGGAEIMGVKGMLGHSSVVTTQGYAHMVPEIHEATAARLREYSRGLLPPLNPTHSPREDNVQDA